MIPFPANPIAPVRAVRMRLSMLPDVPRAVKPPALAASFVGHPCPICGVALTDATLAWTWIVPPAHYAAPGMGGADRFAACVECVSKRGAADLLDIVIARPGDLLDRRRVLLLGGAHHPTPWTDRGAILRALGVRVDQPRASVAAMIDAEGAAVIGWSARSGGASTLGMLAALLRSQHSAIRVPDDDAPLAIGDRTVPSAVCFRVPPAHALDSMQAVIESGSLVLPAEPTMATADDYRTSWCVRWHSISEHLRRVDEHLFPVPVPTRARSGSSGASRMRALRALRKAAGG